jgi:diaminopimelate decarboxylase
MPEAWPIRVTAHDSSGALKDGPGLAQDIGGPLCFAGDVVARNRPIPELEPDDFVVLHDTGAYYFTSPWTYNSIPSPPVYGFTMDARRGVRFVTIRKAQSLEEVVAANGIAFKDALLDGLSETAGSPLSVPAE